MAKLLEIHPVLGAPDVPASIHFYRGLGFSLAFVDDELDPRYAALRREGIEIHLQWCDTVPAASADRPVYRFLVDDVDALFEELDGAGIIPADHPSPWARPGDTPWGTRELHLHDPAGNGLQFYRGVGPSV